MTKPLEKLAGELISKGQFQEALDELQKIKSIGKRIHIITFNLFLYCLTEHSDREIIFTNDRNEYEQNKQREDKIFIYEDPKTQDISGEDKENLVKHVLGEKHPILTYLNDLFEKEEVRKKT